MKISLHLGAHKTASTFMQEVLENNAAALLARRCLMVPMEEFRTGVTHRLPSGGTEAEDAARRERAARKLDGILSRDDVDRAILSDENLLGTPRQMVVEGRPYPDVARALAPLAPLLAGHEVALFLAIRQQGNFSRSLYSETFRAPMPEFVPVERFRQQWLAEPRSWLPLIDQIRALFPESHLTVWDFSNIKTESQRLLNAVAGLDAPMEFNTAKAFRRASLSHEAVSRLIEIGAASGPEEMFRRKEEIRLAYPRGRGVKTFEIWSREEKRVFHRQLTQDLKALREAGPMVTVLE